MSELIQPRVLSGFRDYLPDAMTPREQLIATARKVYRSYGFAPIDTPALEYLDILAGKGSEETDRQMYRFTDHGGREVGMRFDLTIPLARFAAQHIGVLGTPFKRYHIATVWRGERKQRGRYREFMQCDFDTIGTASIAADIETALVIHDLMRALGLERFTIRLNNRKVLNGLLTVQGLSSQSVLVLRALDKLGKIGIEGVRQELTDVVGASGEQADRILQFASLDDTNEAVLDQLDSFVAGSDVGGEGVAELRQTIRGIRASGVDEERLRLDVSIARGLDYYTGTVYETFLDDLPAIGSVCSGGRYDNLAELYTKQKLPGVGASLGLDRLLAALEELGALMAPQSPAPVLIAFFSEDKLDEYLRMAALLRGAGVGVELYPEPKKLGQQLKYADRRGFKFAIIAGEDEFSRGEVQVKELYSGVATTLAFSESGAELSGFLIDRLKSAD